ncbi:MAG: hypothetical protein L3J82_00495 [Planctomycetes bacterium]|nr:hypothetical protein [Planctomycetota bacterium]
MKRAARIYLPLLAAVAVAVVSATAFGQADDDYYWFKQDKELAAGIAAKTEISPEFKVVADDAFAYEFYYNVNRTSKASEGAIEFTGSTSSENWILSSTLSARENPLKGQKDLQLAFHFDQIRFIVDNGQAKWAGVVNLDVADFTEVKPDGTPDPATTIPGWPGVSASDIQRALRSQGASAASAWVSIDGTSKLSNEIYFADYSSPNQASYPGRLLDPIDLMRCMFPQWNADLTMKIGDTVSVIRSFPVSGVAGGTMEYKFTYTLNKLFGTTEEGNTEATSAAFSFKAEPVSGGIVSQKLHGMEVKFTAPKINDGYLLYDLNKGMPAIVSWSYSLTGSTAEVAAKLGSDFEVEVEFSASLSQKPDGKDAE